MGKHYYPWFQAAPLTKAAVWYMVEMFRFTTQEGTLSPPFAGIARLAEFETCWRLDYRIPWFKPVWKVSCVADQQAGDTLLYDNLLRDGLWLASPAKCDRVATLSRFVFPELVIIRPADVHSRPRRMIM